MKFIQNNKIQDKVEKLESYLKTTDAYISNLKEEGGQTYFGGYSLIESPFDNKNKEIWFVGINCGTGYKSEKDKDLKSLYPISEEEFQEEVESNLFIRKISELFSDQEYELTSYSRSYFISNLHIFATYDEATLKEYISESNLGSEINREYNSLIEEINFNIFQELNPRIIIAIGRQVRQVFNKIFRKINIEFEDEKNYVKEDSRHWLYKTKHKGEDLYFIDALRGRKALRNSEELAKKIKVILSKT